MTMCTRLLSCPLCSQPGFTTLDALQIGLVSVSTRPLTCPVCNEILIGIEKLTIHLFSHTIHKGNLCNSPISESNSNNNSNISTAIHNGQTVSAQTWNILNSPSIDTIKKASGYENTINNPTKTYKSLENIINTENKIICSNNYHTSDKCSINVSNVNNNDNIKKSKSPKLMLPNLNTKLLLNNKKSDNEYAENVIANIKNKLIQNKNSNDPIIMDQASDNKASTQISREENISDKPRTERTVILEISSKENNPIPIERKNDEISENSFSSKKQTDILADLVKNTEIAASPLNEFQDGNSKPSPALSDSLSASTMIKQKPKVTSIQIIKKSERCSICGYQIADMKTLILHKQLAHNIFTNSKSHAMSEEQQLKNFPCYFCRKVFKMRGSLMIHMRVAHPQNGLTGNSPNPPESNTDNGFKCPVCGKYFKKEQHVTQHLKIHDGNKYDCDVCGKQFSTKYFLKKHKRLHSGETPYKCEICDKTFTFQQSYHKHTLYHKSDKPHVCNTCGRSFKELSTLHNHERIHTGEKPFACETCGKCFRQRVSYLVHQRIHNGVMPYECFTCGKKFRYKVSLKTHRCPQETNELDSESEMLVQRIIQVAEQNKLKEIAEKRGSIDDDMDNNQYIVVLDEEGQPIVRKHSEIENLNQVDDNMQIGENIIVDNTENIWNQEILSDDNHILEHHEANGISKVIVLDNEKNLMYNQQPDDQLMQEFYSSLSESSFKNPSKPDANNDILSMWLSSNPTEGSSPSKDLEHLRLSSPQEEPNIADTLPLQCNNATTVRVEEFENESFNENNSSISTLQPINEDSLKEILYGAIQTQ